MVGAARAAGEQPVDAPTGYGLPLGGQGYGSLAGDAVLVPDVPIERAIGASADQGAALAPTAFGGSWPGVPPSGNSAAAAAAVPPSGDSAAAAIAAAAALKALGSTGGDARAVGTAAEPGPSGLGAARASAGPQRIYAVKTRALSKEAEASIWKVRFATRPQKRREKGFGLPLPRVSPQLAFRLVPRTHAHLLRRY